MIRVTRGSYLNDGNSTYKIYINGVHSGGIKDSQTIEFPVESGRHEVYAKINWCRSNKLFVEVRDSTVDVEVGPSIMGWKLLSVPVLTLAFIISGWRFLSVAAFAIPLVYVTFLRSKYLWLKEKRG